MGEQLMGAGGGLATRMGRARQVLEEKKLGLTAHFYMDPEVQGVLAAAAARWPLISVSDSLVMADAAVRMADAGCTAVAVLGVDFMSENVRAILDEAGHTDVQASAPASSCESCLCFAALRRLAMSGEQRVRERKESEAPLPTCELENLGARACSACTSACDTASVCMNV